MNRAGNITGCATPSAYADVTAVIHSDICLICGNRLTQVEPEVLEKATRLILTVSFKFLITCVAPRCSLFLGLGDPAYESLARKGEAMTTAEKNAYVARRVSGQMSLPLPALTTAARMAGVQL